ncbi:MAG: hypothetical protein AB8I69_00960 [Anaerolineae bacterium]|jgi:hypothetical protein
MNRPVWHLGRYLMIAVALSLLLSSCECAAEGALFQDDFENPNSGWGADQRDGFDRGYDEGVYFFDLRASNWLAWASPGKDFDDVSIEVNARVASGAQDAHYGVICRYKDADNFYYLAISADGYYAIFRRDDGDMEILTPGGGMLSSPHIKTGKQVNKILGVCKGDDLSLYVNGQWLATVTDDTHARGDVGLGASSGPGGGTRVVFDDFVVTAP